MSDLDARVLVCDPTNLIFPQIARVLHKRFVGDDLPEHWTMKIMHGFGKFRDGGIEYTLVDDLDNVVRYVKAKQAPYYSLVLYSISQIKRKGSAGVVAGVRKKDFFLPQMIVGGGLSYGRIAQCTRGGALYLAEHIAEAQDQISKIFRRPFKLPNVTVVKIGGSSFDYDRQVHSKNLEYICKALIKIHKRKRDRIISTVGTGQYGDVQKDWTKNHSTVRRIRGYFPLGMAFALQLNAENIKQIFGQKGALIKTGAFYYVDKKSTKKIIPIMGIAPHYIVARDKIPLQDSDTHTIALAEFYGAERVILIKRTDGIYNFDPNRGYILDQVNGGCADLEAWKEVQRRNRLIESITISQMLNGKILRDGTGIDGKSDDSAGHLMEDSALRYMKKKCQYVREICVVHIAPEEMYYPIDKNVYRHIVTGEELKLPRTGWKGVLEQSIRDAFNGKAKSKILRE